MTSQKLISSFALIALSAAQAVAAAPHKAQPAAHLKASAAKPHAAPVAKPAPARPGESAVTRAERLQMVRFGGPNGSFCYAKEDAPIQGYNIDKPVKIASVMKLLTTFWAVETRGVDSRFETLVTIQKSNKEIHIAGSRDPFFDRYRLGLLLADLNRMGIKEINRITVDSNFWIDYGALDFLQWAPAAHATNHAGTSLAARDIKQKIIDGFNTATWSKSTKALYADRAKEGGRPQLPPTVEMKVDAVDIVPSNPLAGKPGAVTYVLRSAPLKMYIRKMNILSANPMADELFASLGGIRGFQSYMSSRFGTTLNFSEVSSGSGLPVEQNGVRKDTEVTCRTVVSLVRRLDRDLEKQGQDLADVMMVMAKDNGTMKEKSGGVIAKTGTVNGGKNLAGVENTASGEVYFGIFLQGRAAGGGRGSKNIRDALTTFQMSFNPKSYNASPLRFDPLDSAMQLTPLKLPQPPVDLRKL